jgi:hypothetical protein
MVSTRSECWHPSSCVHSSLCTSTMERSRANWLNRIMSNIILHIRREKRFLRCAKAARRDLPDHSKNPSSLDTPYVICVNTVGAFITSRKAVKFAASVGMSILYAMRGRGKPTISGGIQSHEAGIDKRFISPIFKFHCVCVSPQPIGGFVHVYIVVRSIQSPESAYTSRATADDSDLLSRKPVCMRIHGRSNEGQAADGNQRSSRSTITAGICVVERQAIGS